MKRILIVVGAVIVVAIIALIAMAQTSGGPQQLVEITFMGFSNTPAGPVALTAMHFRPGFDGAHWVKVEARRVSGEWAVWTPPPGDPRPPYDFKNMPQLKPRLPNGKTINHIIAFAVENTNDMWRLVMEIKETRPRQKESIAWRVRSWWNALRKVPQPFKQYYNGSHYFLTNETRKMN